MKSESLSTGNDTQKITSVTGTGIVVRGNDIDTDRIIPARYLKVVTFDGIGEFAFQDVRVDQEGKRTDHPFNAPAYGGASILLVNKNFGCGSSREHAPQALLRWGIKAIVGESFAEIFAGNCNALGVPAVCLSEPDIEVLMKLVEGDPAARLTLNLAEGTVTSPAGSFRCSMPDTYREALLAGIWDSAGVLLANRERIEAKAMALPYMNGYR